MRRHALRSLLAAAAVIQTLVAAYPPQDPAASLDALLHDIWAQGADKAYELYMGKANVPMDGAARQAFPAKMVELAQGPNVGAMILQKAKSEVYGRNKLPEPSRFDDAYFVHFAPESFGPDDINERIYINVHPDHAADVITFIVRELFQPGSEGSRRGVVEAKVATPSGLSTRADSILIYLRSLTDVDRALARLAEYQTSHAGYFLKDLPAATRPRLIGVSTAAQPVSSLKAESFGSYLSMVAESAMKLQPPPADFAEFRNRVRARMVADGVDPDHPDRLTRRP
jgi:hypothetical protein